MTGNAGEKEEGRPNENDSHSHLDALEEYVLNLLKRLLIRTT
tara:strand:- start:70 stop:195 length:126 start_codon:yes stop_codon:yes gene_type:complete